MDIKVGDKYNMLTVLGLDEKRNSLEKERVERGEIKKLKLFYLCQCECGTIKSIRSDSLKGGRTKSCGCLIVERNKELNTKDGRCKEHRRLYKIYKGMINRCTNEKCDNFNHYGGRGIKVYDEWLDDKNGWQNFLKWSYSNGYQDDLSIDRIDVNGNYEPNNCRWIDWQTQCNNRRNNTYVTINNETKTMAQWCVEYGIDYSTFQHRLKNGMCGEDLLKATKKRKNNKYKYIVTNLNNNETTEFNNVYEFVEMFGMCSSYISKLLTKNENVLIRDNYKVERMMVKNDNETNKSKET